MSSTGPKSPSSKDPLLTVPDVAARLKVSERTVWRLITERRLKVKRIGRSVRVAESDLVGLID